MRCPYCGSKETKVVNSAPKGEYTFKFSKKYADYYENEDDYRLRSIRCSKCDRLFVTVETYAYEQ